MEPLDDARGDDADHSRMPALFGEYDAIGRRQIHLENERTCLLERRAIDLLAPSVELLELARDRIGVGVVFAQQELDTFECVGESPDGIETRRENEADPPRVERLPLETDRANERVTAGDVWKKLEPDQLKELVLQRGEDGVVEGMAVGLARQRKGNAERALASVLDGALQLLHGAGGVGQ